MTTNANGNGMTQGTHNASGSTFTADTVTVTANDNASETYGVINGMDGNTKPGKMTVDLLQVTGINTGGGMPYKRITD